MNKIFPIKVEKAIPQDYKFVEWKIHNVCNYNCSFCGSKHKDGSNRWFSLEKYKEYADKIINSCGNEKIWIQFTGGEPTLFPSIIELMSYVKQKGAYVSLITNGSRTIRWWNDLKESKAVDLVFITYHPDMTSDYNHIIEILNLLHCEPIVTVCLITHTKNTIEDAIFAAEKIVENTGAYVTVKAMMIGAYNIYSLYNETQLAKLKQLNGVTGKNFSTKNKNTIPGQNHKLKIINNDNSEIFVDPQEIFKNNENNYFGWTCDIGKQSMRIDYKTIYRGVCEVGGQVGNLDNNDVMFQSTSVKCDNTKCFCSTDMISTKIR